MNWANILWIVFVVAMFYVMAKHGGGCCGHSHHAGKETRPDSDRAEAKEMK